MAELKSYTLDDIKVTADGTTQTLAEWQNNPVAMKITKVVDADTGKAIAYDDIDGNPANIVVYVNDSEPENN